MSSVLCPWRSPIEQPRLAADAAHVWCIPLDGPESFLVELWTLLSEDERQRAARFVFEKHRRRFVACRGQVRKILSSYLGAPAEQIRFRYESMGKPALDSPWSDSGVRFNISHSHELALCALTQGRELGVDVEHIREPSDFDGLAERFFAKTEVSVLRSLPQVERLAAFFSCWTRKEALLKATGTGLSFPLDRVVVTLAPDEPARVVAYGDDPSSAGNWWLGALTPAKGYVGAIALSDGAPQVSCWLADFHCQ